MHQSLACLKVHNNKGKVLPRPWLKTVVPTVYIKCYATYHTCALQFCIRLHTYDAMHYSGVCDAQYAVLC